MGKLKYLLGIEVAQPKEGIYLCQGNYFQDLLEDSGFADSKPVLTPSDPTFKLHQDSIGPYSYIPSYRRIVGRLLYRNAIRPDITFCTQHSNATCRSLKYLNICLGHGIMLPRDYTI